MVNLMNFKKPDPLNTCILRFFMSNLVVFFFLLTACKQEATVPEEIEQIPVELDIERFDLKFSQIDEQKLDNLMQEYPYLFPEQYGQEFWIEKAKDSLQQELNEEVAAKFEDLNQEREELETLFKHIKYYYPKTNVPRVVTVTSDVDYHNPVILTDSLLIIALDTYLGSDHPFYGGIQRYYAQNFRREQINVDVASAFAKKIIGRPKGRRFIDEVIYHGKRLYIMERLLTLEPEQEIMGYTPEQLDWAEENEVDIWTYFVENELLFKTDSKLLNRFINPGPFSKFYMEFDNESPPRLGRYIGWQIVSSYMERNNIPLQMLPGKSTEEIFQNANYKPRK